MVNNTRRFDRIELVDEVYFESNHKEILARWTDICLRGIFVQTMEPLPPGEQVKLRLKVGSEKKFYRAVGVVRHSLRWVGMGLEFTHLHPGAKQTIENLTSVKL